MTRKEKGPDAAKNLGSAGAAKLLFYFLSFNRVFFFIIIFYVTSKLLAQPSTTRNLFLTEA